FDARVENWKAFSKGPAFARRPTSLYGQNGGIYDLPPEHRHRYRFRSTVGREPCPTPKRLTELSKPPVRANSSSPANRWSNHDRAMSAYASKLAGFAIPMRRQLKARFRSLGHAYQDT